MNENNTKYYITTNCCFICITCASYNHEWKDLITDSVRINKKDTDVGYCDNCLERIYTIEEIKK